MPHYLTPLSSVTTVTTCRLEGRSPRRPKTTKSVSNDSTCGHSSTDTDNSSNTSKDSTTPEPPSQLEAEDPEGDIVSSVDEFIDAVECSVKDDITDESSMSSEVVDNFPIKAQASDESSVTSEVLDCSPMQTELSSDVSLAKSAISGDSPVKLSNSGTSDESERPGVSASLVPSQSPAVSSVAQPGPPAAFSPERLQAASDVIGRCGQSSGSGTPAVQQPRDFSRERPPAVNHIRRAAKRTQRRKSANPKRRRTDSADITDLMRTSFYPCD